MTRRGDWFITYSGVQFWPMDPRPEEVRIEDIAHALSRVCRYGGHCLDWYSVAQHSVLVSQLVGQQLAFEGLMHDAEEAYTGDMIRPVKVGLRDATPAFDEMADRLTAAIRVAFGMGALGDAAAAAIHNADNVALSTERRDLVTDKGPPWRHAKSHPAVATKIVPWERDVAKATFLHHFEMLRPR